MTHLDLTDPTTATLAIARALEAIGLRAAVYGGLAFATHSHVRDSRRR